MFELYFDIDDEDVRRRLNDIERRQVPFAAATAMNETMKDAQGAVRRDAFMKVFQRRNVALPKALTTIPRNKFATKRNLRVEMTNVRDARTGRYAGAGFARRQIEGKTKNPRGSNIAVPVIGPGMKRLKSGSLPKNKKAKNRNDLIKIGKVLYQRPRKKLVPRFVLTKQARPNRRGRFKYYSVAERVIRRNIHFHWEKAFRRAVRSAR